MRRFILTGDRGSGKTTFCQNLCNEARARGRTVSGIVTLTRRNEELTAVDLFTGKSCKLADFNESFLTKAEGVEKNLNTKQWIFRASAISWGNLQICRAPPCDLFILDEAGILEFERDLGWTRGMTRVDAQREDCCVIVVRPELVSLALERWCDAELLTIHESEDRHEHEKGLVNRILDAGL